MRKHHCNSKRTSYSLFDIMNVHKGIYIVYFISFFYRFYKICKTMNIQSQTGWFIIILTAGVSQENLCWLTQPAGMIALNMTLKLHSICKLVSLSQVIFTQIKMIKKNEIYKVGEKCPRKAWHPDGTLFFVLNSHSCLTLLLITPKCNLFVFVSHC